MEKNIASDPSWRELKALCDSEMRKLKEMEVEYDKISTTSVVFSNDQNPEELLKHRILFRLMAELSGLDSSSARNIPMNEKLLLLTARQEMLSEFEDLKSLKSSLQEEKEIALQTYGKVKSDLEEERRHLTAVKQKCITQRINVDGTDEIESNDVQDFASDDDDHHPLHGDNDVHSFQKRIKALKTLYDYRKSQLDNFVDTYFPAPNAEQVESVASDDIFAQFSGSYMMSLAVIINKLLTSYFKDQESWLKLDSAYWIPHVEFLIRSGIVVRKSEDPSLLKLLV